MAPRLDERLLRLELRRVRTLPTVALRELVRTAPPWLATLTDTELHRLAAGQAPSWLVNKT